MRFVFRPGLAVAFAAALAILLSLGVWQLQRLKWKEALIAAVETREAAPPIAFDAALAKLAAGQDVEFQRVYLDGAYDSARRRRVFGAKDGVAGAFMFEPLARGARAAVWINRGFAPDGAVTTDAPSGVLHVVGVLRRPERPTALEALVAVKDQPQDNLYFRRMPARFKGAEGTEIRAYVESDGQENPAPTPKAALTQADFPNRHFEYALTWFGLATALTGVYLAYSLKR